ncbi:MAG: M1 family metallopeptidase [Rubricoccaceae bacterium]|nr:M1 family metallopeptidase [Rubricoccaceae bacterium]
MFLGSGWLGCTASDNRQFLSPQDGVDVLRYELTLSIDPETRHLDGVASLVVHHPDTLSVLQLQLRPEMDVHRVSLGGAPGPYLHDNGRLDIGGLSGDSSIVEIAYRGTMRTGIRDGMVGDQHVLFSESWPMVGAGWLPGVHHPSDPAQVEFEITLPGGYHVVANGAVESTSSQTATGTTTYFSLLEDAPIYTFAFAVSDRFTVEIDSTSSGIPIRHYLLDEDRLDGHLLSRTPQVLSVLENLLGPYPYASYSTVEVPMEYAGMENASASFLASDLYDRPVTGGRNLLEEVNIHEAAHQWFGNDVVPADWRDLWLSEGMATYLTTVVFGLVVGGEAAREHRTRMALISDRDARRVLVPNSYDAPEDLLTATVYQKGGCVLHLLRLRFGDEAFFDALRHIREEYDDLPLSTGHFQAALERAFETDLSVFFDHWVYGDNIPVLRTNWNRQTRMLTWEIEGDEGTLEGIDFELMILQKGTLAYYPVSVGSAVIDAGDVSDEPEVHPVGVLLSVR